MEKPLKLAARDLSFFYGDFQALHDITLDFYTNQVTALIGPSGCGKSTLLRCINRMNDLIPYSRVEGELLLDERNVYNPAVDVVTLRRHIGHTRTTPPSQAPSQTVSTSTEQPPTYTSTNSQYRSFPA